MTVQQFAVFYDFHPILKLCKTVFGPCTGTVELQTKGYLGTGPFLPSFPVGSLGAKFHCNSNRFDWSLCYCRGELRSLEDIESYRAILICTQFGRITNKMMQYTNSNGSASMVNLSF